MKTGLIIAIISGGLIGAWAWQKHQHRKELSTEIVDMTLSEARRLGNETVTESALRGPLQALTIPQLELLHTYITVIISKNGPALDSLQPQVDRELTPLINRDPRWSVYGIAFGGT